MSRLKRLKRGGLGLLAIVSLGAAAYGTGILDRVEQATVDWRFANFNRDARPADDVVLVDIDDESLKNYALKYGRWPWPRHIYKEMIEFLALNEPSSILFDLIFPEPQLGTNDDEEFSLATRNFPQVSQAMQFLRESSRDGQDHVKLPGEIEERFRLKWRGSPPDAMRFQYHQHDYVLPFPGLLASLHKLHVVTTQKDPDGLFRRMPMIIPYDGHWFPSLTLQALLTRLKDPQVAYAEGKLTLFEGERAQWEIPLDADGMYRLNFYRYQKFPNWFRIGEVMDSTAAQLRGDTETEKWAVNPLALNGKIVLVGGSAVGLEDLKATPIASSFPGVLLHATAISNILKSDFLREAPGLFTFLVLLVLSLFSYFSIFYFERTIFKSLAPMMALLTYTGIALFLFRYNQLVLNMTIPLAGGVASFIDGFIYMSFVEGRERRRMTGTLSKYLSPELANQLAEGGVDPTAEVGRKQELSVMFTDIRGFTTLSEQMKPEHVVTILNEYLGEMTQIVFDHRGTLDKFIGDAVMAFWGAPVADSEHALRALKTGFAMIKRLRELNAAWESKGLPALAMGVGINTGQVIVGNIGSEKRLDYTVIGDNVNLASRIEGLTKYYGVEFIIGPATYAQVSAAFLCRPLDLVRVKGKAEAVAIYEPLIMLSEKGGHAERARRLAEKFTIAWLAYQKGNFRQAATLFNECLELSGGKDGPSQVYVERCRELLTTPPGLWDGVYVAKSK